MVVTVGEAILTPRAGQLPYGAKAFATLASADTVACGSEDAPAMFCDQVIYGGAISRECLKGAFLVARYHPAKPDDVSCKNSRETAFHIRAVGHDARYLLR